MKYNKNKKVDNLKSIFNKINNFDFYLFCRYSALGLVGLETYSYVRDILSMGIPSCADLFFIFPGFRFAFYAGLFTLLLLIPWLLFFLPWVKLVYSPHFTEKDQLKKRFTLLARFYICILVVPLLLFLFYLGSF